VSGPGQQAGRRGNLVDPVVQVFRAADVDDQRVSGRASLDLEGTRDGDGVLGVGAKAVDRFGREGHQTSGPQHVGRLLDVTGARRHARDPNQFWE
jgi:hypothetical protein